MLRFATELLPALLVGLLLGHRFPGLPAHLAPPLIRWGVPISLVGLLLRSGLHRELLVAGAMPLLATGLGLALLRLWPALRRRIPSGTLQLGCLTGNTAYWGLPVAIALLPASALSQVIAYDLVATLITWTLGPLLVQGIPARPGSILAGLRSSPASRGLVIALLLQLTPWSGAIAGWLWWPSRLVILLALSVVGMRLGAMLQARQSVLPAGTGVGAALWGKLLVLPAGMLLLALTLQLPVLVRDAVVLQAAAPTAISVLLLAEASDRDGEQAAGLVLWSTLLGLGSVPLWWMLLARLGPA